MGSLISKEREDESLEGDETFMKMVERWKDQYGFDGKLTVAKFHLQTG